MLDTIVNALDWFLDLGSNIVNLLDSIISGFIGLFKALPSVITYLVASVSNLPSTLVVFALLTITISVVYLIANRQTGG